MDSSDGAVEAIARALFGMSYDPIMWDWASTLSHRQTCINKARLAVEVATPIIGAAAYDHGFTDCNWEYRKQAVDPSYPITRNNPYKERKMTPTEVEEWRRTCPYPEALGK